jgi:uncharacterized membrane protein
MKDSRIRSVSNALTWRAIATSTTVVTAYIVTSDLKVAGAISAADVVIKLFFYYLHERAWGRVSWGRSVRFGKG